MSLNPLQIAAHPSIIPTIQRQSEALLAIYGEQARLASIFASQQGWLLAMAAFAVYFRKQRSVQEKWIGITAAEFCEFVERHRITSINTAESFFKKTIHYGFTLCVASPDRRARPVAPSEEAVAAIAAWIAIHLSTLDALDGGDRVGAASGDMTLLSHFQPAITDRLLANEAIRNPAPVFGIFTWLNQGGLMLERLFCGLQEPGPDGRIMTNIVSISLLASWLKLSRSHLHRKLREAEAIGGLGWSGARGQSPLWVSDAFLSEMLAYQANKLAIIDDAFDAVRNGEGLPPANRPKNETIASVPIT